MNEFIRQGDDIIINAGYAEAYIPEEMFSEVDTEAPKSAIAYMNGSQVHTLGIFNMRFMNSDDEDIDPAKIKLKTFNYPTAIDTFPSEVTKEKLALLPGEEPSSYRVLKYLRGDIMMRAQTIQASDNCELFINTLLKGKIPVTIPYDQLIHIWHENYRINGMHPGTSSVTLQMIISEMYRYKQNPSSQFRKAVGKGGCSQYDYIPGNMRLVASYTNVMNALTFENMGEMLTTSINMTRSGQVQDRTPLEKVLSM